MFLSISNADNAYGSEVVANVLHTRSVPPTSQPNPQAQLYTSQTRLEGENALERFDPTIWADMVIVPVDSRNWEHQTKDYLHDILIENSKAIYICKHLWITRVYIYIHKRIHMCVIYTYLHISTLRWRISMGQYVCKHCST